MPRRDPLLHLCNDQQGGLCMGLDGPAREITVTPQKQPEPTPEKAPAKQPVKEPVPA